MPDLTGNFAGINGMAISRQMLSNPVGRFIDYLLRGVSQVMLQNNPITGFLFLFGIFISDWISGLYALLGTLVATGTAMVFGAPHHDVSRGMYGFNGTLIGLSLAYQERHDPILFVYVVLAAMFATIVMAAIKHMFGVHGHTLTGPFVITIWFFMGSLFTYGRLLEEPARAAAIHSPVGVAQVAVLNPSDALLGILNGPAQVMLQQGAWTGAIFLIAIAVNSRISCIAAVIGSAVGVGTAWWLQGAAPYAIRDGLYGFNAVLTAVALGGLFFRLHRITVLLAILAACVSTIMYGSFVVILKPLGLPVLTAPFVFTTWLCLLASASLPRLKALTPVDALTPEGNLLAARRAASKIS